MTHKPVYRYSRPIILMYLKVIDKIPIKNREDLSICEYIDFLTFNSGYTIGCDISDHFPSEKVSDFLRSYIKNWKYKSDNLNLPVTTYNYFLFQKNNPYYLYKNTHKWKGRYGRMRNKLLKFLIREIEKDVYTTVMTLLIPTKETN